MRAKLAVAAVVALTLIFCWGLGWVAWGFSRAGGVVGWGLALAVGVLVALTLWVTWREVLFGLAASRLTRLMGAPDGLDARDELDAPDRLDDRDARDELDPADGLPASDAPEDRVPADAAPGRPEREARARAAFEQARRAVESAESDGGSADWREWYRLSLAYDACRDRRHARECLRTAIRRERESRTA